MTKPCCPKCRLNEGALPGKTLPLSSPPGLGRDVTLPVACLAASPACIGLVLPAGALLLLLAGGHPALRREEEGE